MPVLVKVELEHDSPERVKPPAPFLEECMMLNLGICYKEYTGTGRFPLLWKSFSDPPTQGEKKTDWGDWDRRPFAVEQSPDKDPNLAKEGDYDPDQPQSLLYKQMLGIPVLHRSKVGIKTQDKVVVGGRKPLVNGVIKVPSYHWNLEISEAIRM